jgi:iron uptake system component EfeO
MIQDLLRVSLAIAAIATVAIAGGCGSTSDVPKGATKLSFKLTDQGCVPRSASAPAGPILFDVENAGTSAVSEFEVLENDSILGEKEDLSEGLSGSFSLTLDPGRYTIYCPGGSDERGTLAVAGSH